MTPEEIVRKVTALTGFTHAAGVEVLAAEAGLVTLSLKRKPELLQFNGYFHGGVVSGLADHAAGAAATTALAPGKIAVTVDLHINFLAPARGSSLEARARTLQVGGTLCVVAVELDSVTPSDKQLCAVATVTLRVVDMPPLPA